MTYTPVFSVHGTRHSLYFFFFFFNDTATTEIYPLSLPDALPIYRELIGPAFPAAAQRLTQPLGCRNQDFVADAVADRKSTRLNSSHLVISYAVFCLKKKKTSNDCIDIALHSSLISDR